MKVTELNYDQLNVLRVNIMEKRGLPVSWSNLADASEIISDEQVFKEFSSYDFSIDDFGF